MNVRQVIATQEAEKGFYPTPAQLADKLLEGINWYHVHDILEPSAGKGDLIQAVLRNAYHYDENRYQFSLNKAVYDVDAIEIDPYLRSILAYEFSEANLQRNNELRNRRGKGTSREVAGEDHATGINQRQNHP